ncbi:lipocalin-like domain-containing protein [Bradyrhizobium sp. CCBAU 51745]|uniref:lipocalin-like domain-containing protein n=1 Tax=Bradyrhizobium sp. CCBAU 51745 TaxID=1325099 RepID=UPI002306913D|nr:lipocalin-like domain-containing protein [Bradyrhizobium sp. CCBAU 51745]
MAAALGLFLHANSATGQQRSMKEGLVGTWIAVSWEQRKNDGTTLRQFGENPAGMAIFDAGGRYIIAVMRSDRAKYKSNTLWQGTAEENEAIANGTQTYFGTYTVNESDRSIAIHVEGSSFPNWNGSDQKRFVTITGDQLTLTIRPPSGENVDVTWRRAK